MRSGADGPEAIYTLKQGERAWQDRPAPVGTSRETTLGAPVRPSK